MGIISTPASGVDKQGMCVTKMCSVCLVVCIALRLTVFTGLRVRRTLTEGVGNEPLSFHGTRAFLMFRR